jgi:hypothetical protein
MHLSLNRDLSQFDCRIIPKTEARNDIIEAGISAVYVFIFMRDNYQRFCERIYIQSILEMKNYGSYPEFMKLKQSNFELQLKDKYPRVWKAINKRITYCCILKDDCKKLLKPKTQMEEMHKQAMEDMSL